MRGYCILHLIIPIRNHISIYCREDWVEMEILSTWMWKMRWKQSLHNSGQNTSSEKQVLNIIIAPWKPIQELAHSFSWYCRMVGQGTETKKLQSKWWSQTRDTFGSAAFLLAMEISQMENVIHKWALSATILCCPWYTS